ncbi:MAG TPA: PIN domain-containing protein [Chthoniobacterales bacterium]|nr:PIN domain-containing protein [Chthoniobacterales bacterium]
MSAARIGFADTNWLVSSYHQTRDSSAVQEWAAKGESTIVISVAVLAECECNFWRIGRQWPVLAHDLKRGLWINAGQSFEDILLAAADLFRQFAPRCNVGTFDLLHVAAARRFGCRWFLSFDSNSGCRAVAHACGLRVFPELNAQDRIWLRKFGH